VSSYSINKGPTTIFNATETAGYQFQQKLFQSARLNDSVPHTIVVTLINNGTFFIDYFLVIPSSSLAGPTTVSGADSSATASAGDRSQSSRVSLGPAVGGALGGFALLIVAILAVWLCCKRRRKDKNQRSEWIFFRSCVTCAMNIFIIIIHRGSCVSCPFRYSCIGTAVFLSTSYYCPNVRFGGYTTIIQNCSAIYSLSPRRFTSTHGFTGTTKL
jgi:hypothetical protein